MTPAGLYEPLSPGKKAPQNLETEKHLALTEALQHFTEGLSTDQSHIRKLSSVDEHLGEMSCKTEGGLFCYCEFS